MIPEKENDTEDDAPYDYIKEDAVNNDYKETSEKEINNDNQNSKKNKN
jgi:hypothetical protein